MKIKPQRQTNIPSFVVKGLIWPRGGDDPSWHSHSHSVNNLSLTTSLCSKTTSQKAKVCIVVSNRLKAGRKNSHHRGKIWLKKLRKQCTWSDNLFLKCIWALDSSVHMKSDGKTCVKKNRNTSCLPHEASYPRDSNLRDCCPQLKRFGGEEISSLQFSLHNYLNE